MPATASTDRQDDLGAFGSVSRALRMLTTLHLSAPLVRRLIPAVSTMWNRVPSNVELRIDRIAGRTGQSQHDQRSFQSE